MWRVEGYEAIANAVDRADPVAVEKQRREHAEQAAHARRQAAQILASLIARRLDAAMREQPRTRVDR